MKLFELFPSGQTGIFSRYAASFFQPIVPTLHFGKDLAYLENLLCLTPAGITQTKSKRNDYMVYSETKKIKLT